MPHTRIAKTRMRECYHHRPQLARARKRDVMLNRANGVEMLESAPARPGLELWRKSTKKRRYVHSERQNQSRLLCCQLLGKEFNAVLNEGVIRRSGKRAGRSCTGAQPQIDIREEAAGGIDAHLRE